jgi:hypothetical protein
MKYAWAGVLTIASVATMPARAASASDGERWWSHVRILADDKLEGRDTGSPGHRKAAEYVAGEFKRLGLEPAGTESFIQPVKFSSNTIDESQTRLEIVRTSGTETLELGADALVLLQVNPAKTLDAALVFAGYGLTVPDYGHDDFREIDVRRKVVVFFSGAPATLPGPLASHAQSLGERATALRRAGALGMIRIANPKFMDIPWSRRSLARLMPSMSLADPAMDEGRGLSLDLSLNPARAEKLFAGSDHTFQEIVDADDAHKPLPHFAIPARLKATVGVRRSDVTSQNVAAVLPGSDPKLKGEYVVLSAHLDHIGIGEPINGDSIYNGAMDNASGVAGLLDVAEILKETGAQPKRSLLFLAVTGEEKGLQGSRYFASAPTVPSSAIVADINTDMFLPLYPFKRLIAFGLDESDLKNDVNAVAGPAGLPVLPDPEPKRNIFIRSDQYSFVRQGIPSLMLMVGYEKGTKEEATLLTWLKDRYHAPSDDLSQPVDKPSAGDFDAFVAKLITHVANRDTRPQFSDSSFFKRFAH